MSEAAEGKDYPSGQNSMGPDYFGYYAQEVAELLSQDENLLPCSSNNPEFVGVTGSIGSSPPFCEEAVGAGLSDNKKERLRAILNQSVVIFSQEVDEMLDPVFNMRRLKSWIRQQRSSSHPEKHVSSLSLPLHASPHSCSPTRKLNEDLQILLDNVGEERIRKHSEDLSTTLGYMLQKLEELLDIVMSSCRPMTDVEKHQLAVLIKNLPPDNLNHVVEILRRRNPLENKSLDIDVNLEYEDNTALWRLHYYVNAFENAKKLRQKSNSCT